MKTNGGASERVEREDMVMFINACFACTGQREFYCDARGQSVSIEFLHAYILGNYRRLYARCLAAGINHFNKAQVIVNLLATGKDTPAAQREEEGELIFAALRSQPTQRAYRLLESLRKNGINNRRARAVSRKFLMSRADLAFEALKYRNKLRAVATHAHLPLPGEVGMFLFRGWQQRVFKTPLFEQFRQAHYSKEAVYQLPYTIAEGFAGKLGIARDEFLSRIQGRMTMEEKLRLQKAAKRETLSLDMDLGKVGLTRLAIFLLALPVAERKKFAPVIEAAFEQSARRVLRRAPERLERVAAIFDRSFSSSGTSEKRRRPLAVAWAASQLLRVAAKEYRAFWTPRLDVELEVAPEGQTDLASPLLEALEWGADLVIIVSDGHENDPPGGAAEVARVFRKRLDPERRVSIVHMNPVFDAEHYAPRTIGAAIPTVGLRDAEDLLTMLGFARFADGSAPLSELENYLAARVKLLLHGGSGSASRVPLGEVADVAGGLS